MASIASRDLRNHTVAVLKQVAEGTDVTVTVHGKPVAVITRPPNTRRHGIPKQEFLAMLASYGPDPTLAEDMASISEGTTDDLGPIQ